MTAVRVRSSRLQAGSTKSRRPRPGARALTSPTGAGARRRSTSQSSTPSGAAASPRINGARSRPHPRQLEADGLLQPPDAFLVVQLRTPAIHEVEAVDDLVAEGLDLGMTDVELQVEEGTSDPVQDADRVRRPNLHHRRVLGADVVHGEGRGLPAVRHSMRRVGPGSLGQSTLEGKATVEGTNEVIVEASPIGRAAEGVVDIEDVDRHSFGQ